MQKNKVRDEVQVVPSPHGNPSQRSKHTFRGYAILPFSSTQWSSKLAVERVGPKQPQPSPLSISRPHDHVSFTETFGVLGLPMLFIIVVCIAWTTWLTFLACAPNWVANRLMDMEEFDDGNFWLIVDTEPWMKALSLSGLIAVALCYLYVLLKMVLWQNEGQRSVSKWLGKRVKGWRSLSKAARIPQSWKRKQILASWHDLTSFHGTRRKFWNLWLKTIDLTLQMIALCQMYEAGFPKALVYSYAVLLAANSTSCAVVVLLGSKLSAFTEVLIDSVFDLLFAVVAPIVVLAYSYTNFDFDREALLINDAILPEGTFERQARLMTNPSEVFLFRTIFDSLRILSITDFFLRIGMNLSFCNRFKRVVEVQTARKKRVMFNKRQRSFSVLQPGEKLVPRLGALPFALFALAVLVITNESIAESSSACASYPECVAYVHRWNTDQACPCLILIDADKAPRTYEQWTNPIDLTDTVRHLAKSGDLRVLQLINRKLEAFPDELRHCHHMQHITLMYSQITTIPSWAKGFKELQYFLVIRSIMYCVVAASHIEGKSGSFQNLLSLPDDLFADMQSLTLLHLGVHTRLAKLPSFKGLSNLKRILLAYMCSITEIPSFEPLKKLQKMELVYFSSLPKLPDLAPLAKKLETFVVFRPTQICCNGFLGSCNLTHPFCTANPKFLIPQVNCLENDSDRATPATLKIMKEHTASVCQGVSDVIPESPTKASIDMCAGTLYQQCQLPTAVANGSTVLRTGICFSTRMQAVACTLDPYKVLARQQQILHHAGLPCEPQVEAWLGCT